jgi:hypothetical protein
MRRLDLAGGFQCGGKLRPAAVVVLARLHLGEGLDNLEALLIGEALDQRLLRFETEAGLALLLRGNPIVFRPAFGALVSGGKIPFQTRIRQADRESAGKVLPGATSGLKQWADGFVPASSLVG